MYISHEIVKIIKKIKCEHTIFESLRVHVE